MRFSRTTSASFLLALVASGCSSLLGLDDFAAGESGGTESSATTASGPATGTGGAGPSTGTQSGPGGGGLGGDGSGGGATGPLDVTPGEPKVGILRSLQFTASADVTWAIDEADGGSIDDAGRYLSPPEPGTYHVVATSVADPNVSQSVEVLVVGLAASVVGGIPGGPGNIDGTARKARFDGPYAAAVDASNNGRMYVSDRNNHTIRKFDEQTNQVTTLAGKAGVPGAVDGPGADARFDSPGDVVVSGSVFVADTGNHCIRQINPATGVTSTLAGQCGVAGTSDGSSGASARFDDIMSMVSGVNGSDSLYLCQRSNSGSSIRRINKTSGATSTIITGFSAGTCAMGTDDYADEIYFSAFEGDYVIKGFSEPFTSGDPVTTVAIMPDQSQGLAVMTGIGGENHLYTTVSTYDNVTNRYDNEVRRFDLASGQLEPDPYFGGPEGYVDGPLGDARLNRPNWIGSYRNQGWVLFTDPEGTVRRADVFSDDVETLLGPIPNLEPVDGAKSVARLPTPIGLTLDGAGFAYTSNFSELDNAIRKIDLATGAMSRLSGKRGDFEGSALVDGTADEAVFGIAVDLVWLDGAIYVVDFFGSAIRKVDGTTGDVVTFAGQLGVPGSSDGVGAAAGFQFVDNDGIGGGITTDGTDLYVCDTANYKIRKIDVSTGQVTTIAGGTQGSSDGVGADAQFQGMSGITYADGNLYVTDFLDHTVRKIDLATQAVTTIAGRAGEPGDVDGGLGTSQLKTPLRVVADGIGNLYVAEFQGNVIRRISLEDDVVTTFVGTVGARGFNPAPLPTTLNCPSGMAVDAAGDLLFNDSCDGVVAALRPL